MKTKISVIVAIVVVVTAVIIALASRTTPTPVIATPPGDAAPAKLMSSEQPLPAKLAVTRIAHASVLLDFDGERVLTDPWFTDTEEYHHGEPLGIALGQLPGLTAVVAIHGHYDHFDIKAFAAYPDKTVPFFVAPGMGDAARKAGFTNVTELAPWRSAHAGSLTVTAAPGEHGVPEVIYVIQGKGDTVFFGGDTKLIPALDEVSQRFPVIDLALLAVNGLQVFGRPVVMNDQEAAKLAGQLHARVAVPTHYAFRGGIFSDTFVLSYHGTAEGFARAAKTLAPQTDMKILAPGQRLEIFHVPEGR